MSAEPMLSTYLHNKAILNKIPISGTFELTSRCNFMCEMCYVHEGCEQKDLLSTGDWLRLGEEAREAGTLFLLLTGGEPLLRKDFTELYLKLKDMGFFISLNTNGSLVHKYIDLFKETPPSRVNISLYGCDNDTYENLCKVRMYDRVIENIKLLKSFGVSVKLNAVFTKENKHQLEKIIDTANELNVPLGTTAYAYPQVRLNDDFGENRGRMSALEAAECTLKAELHRFPNELFIPRGEKILAPCSGKSCDGVSCRAGRAAYWITSTGVMQACGMLPAINANVMDLGFKGAWDSVLEQTATVRVPKECLSCSLAEICKSCVAMCYAETGTFDKKPEYVCEMAKNIYKLTTEKMKELGGVYNEN